MAQIKDGKLVLENGQTITPQTGGWYDGQQYWDGTLSAKNQINPLSNQPGAGGQVNKDVVAAGNIDQGLAPGTNEKYLGLNGNNNGNGANGITQTGVVDETQKQIDSLNSSITDKKNKANEAIAKVNENPFLSEGNRVGRIQKINTNLNSSLLVDQQSLANLQAKQTAAKPDTYETTQTDNQGNVTTVIIDKKTGKVINSINLGKIGSADKGTSPNAATTKSAYAAQAAADARSGVTFQQMMQIYGGGISTLSPNEIYALYNTNSVYGPAKEDVSQLKQYGINPGVNASDILSALVAGGQ